MRAACLVAPHPKSTYSRSPAVPLLRRPHRNSSPLCLQMVPPRHLLQMSLPQAGFWRALQRPGRRLRLPPLARLYRRSRRRRRQGASGGVLSRVPAYLASLRCVSQRCPRQRRRPRGGHGSFRPGPAICDCSATCIPQCWTFEMTRSPPSLEIPGFVCFHPLAIIQWTPSSERRELYGVSRS